MKRDDFQHYYRDLDVDHRGIYGYLCNSLSHERGLVKLDLFAWKKNGNRLIGGCINFMTDQAEDTTRMQLAEPFDIEIRDKITLAFNSASHDRGKTLFKILGCNLQSSFDQSLITFDNEHTQPGRYFSASAIIDPEKILTRWPSQNDFSYYKQNGELK